MIPQTLFIISTVLASVSALAVRSGGICSNGLLVANTQCCKFTPLVKELQENVFNNECNTEARETLRLSFHDAMGKSDGSIIEFSDTELAYKANNDTGVADIIDVLKPLVTKFSVSPGDLLFLATSVGLSNCKGAPFIPFKAGRAVPKSAAPDGTVPLPTGKVSLLFLETRAHSNTSFIKLDSVDIIIEKYAAAGFSVEDIVTSLASHSIAAADAVPFGGTPFDSTPAIFDTQFFVETILDDVIPGAARLPSDSALARDNRTACAWQGFIENELGMQLKFADFMSRLGVVGIDQTKLFDCSSVVPRELDFG